MNFKFILLIFTFYSNKLSNMGKLMKLNFLIFTGVLTLSFASFGSESEIFISKIKLNLRTKVDSHLRVNKLNRFYATIAIKRD